MSSSNPDIPRSSILALVVRLWSHLSRQHQVQFFALLVLMIFSSLAEVLSLGAVLPFLGVLIAPQKVFDHPWVNDFAKNLGIASADQLALPLTIGFIFSVRTKTTGNNPGGISLRKPVDPCSAPRRRTTTRTGSYGAEAGIFDIYYFF